MPASLLPNGKQQFEDVNGSPLVGGKVYHFIPDTTTPKDTWQDRDQSTLNENPLTLDERGQAVIWGTGLYRQRVLDADGNLIWDQVTIAPQLGAGGQAVFFDTRALAIAATVGDDVNEIYVSGYYEAGDGGAAAFVRGSAATPGGFTDAGGTEWQFAVQPYNVRMLGAKGDGSNDDTNAWKAAVLLGVFSVPVGTYLITDTIGILEGTQIVGTEVSAANYDEAVCRIKFQPATKRSLFAWATPPATYTYGVYIGGFTVRGFSGGCDAIVDLPYAYGLVLSNLNGFAGFDVGVRIDRWLDCVVTHCSFQGFVTNAVHITNVNGSTTTTRFNFCYFSQGPTCVRANENSCVSITFNSCTFESADTAVFQETKNNIFINSIYLENIPRTDAGEAFRVGLDGTAPTPSQGVLYISGGYLSGYSGGLPANTTFINAGSVRYVSVSNLFGIRFGYFLGTTAATGQVSVAEVDWDNTPWLSAVNGISDMAALAFFGFRPRTMQTRGDSFLSDYLLYSPNLELPLTYSTAETNRKIYNDKALRKLRAKDSRGNILAWANLQAASTTATFNGGRLVKGEVIYASTVGAGKSAGYISQLYSKDIAVTLLACTTTSGSPIIGHAGVAPFFQFAVDDWITISAGFPSTTDQYRIIAVAADQTTITVDTNATSSQVGVTIQYPAHSLLPYGQQGYQSRAGTPVGNLTPNFMGELAFNTSANDWYISIGLTTADWKVIS